MLKNTDETVKDIENFFHRKRNDSTDSQEDRGGQEP